MACVCHDEVERPVLLESLGPHFSSRGKLALSAS